MTNYSMALLLIGAILAMFSSGNRRHIIEVALIAITFAVVIEVVDKLISG